MLCSSRQPCRLPAATTASLLVTLLSLPSISADAALRPPGPHPTPHPQIAYVLGTEDFFHRRRPSKATRDKAARQQKFAAVQAAWLAKQEAAPVVAAA